MIASTCALSQPPPRPSQLSAKPSSWKAPVRRMVSAIDRITATAGGSSQARAR